MADRPEAMLHLRGALFESPAEIRAFRARPGAGAASILPVQLDTATSSVAGRLVGVGTSSPVSLLLPYGGDWSRVVELEPAPFLHSGGVWHGKAYALPIGLEWTRLQRAIAAASKEGMAIEALRARLREMTRFANHSVVFEIVEAHPTLSGSPQPNARDAKRYA